MKSLRPHFPRINPLAYEGVDSGCGWDIGQRRFGFKELSKLAPGKRGEPTACFGQREYLGNFLNTYLHG